MGGEDASVHSGICRPQDTVHCGQVFADLAM